MIRIYLELNAYDRAVNLYESLEIKQIQHESLSYEHKTHNFRYLITDFCHMAGFYSSVRDMILHAQNIYQSNLREV